MLDEIEEAAKQTPVDAEDLAECCEGVMHRAETSSSYTSDQVDGSRMFGGRMLSWWLDHLTIARALLIQERLKGRENHDEPLELADTAVEAMRKLSQPFLGTALLLRAQIRAANRQRSGSAADLDESWDIAERGPMRLELADIHLYRARLFADQPYPWKTPEDDLTAAEKLINDCGYYRRDKELADAKATILR